MVREKGREGGGERGGWSVGSGEEGVEGENREVWCCQLTRYKRKGRRAGLLVRHSV